MSGLRKDSDRASRKGDGLEMRKIIVAMLMALFMSFAIVPVGAEAQPTNCSHYVGTDRRGYAKCWSGTGYYRVGIDCAAPWTFGRPFVQWGNWARVGGQYKSVAACPLGAWNYKYNSNFVSFIEKKDL